MVPKEGIIIVHFGGKQDGSRFRALREEQACGALSTGRSHRLHY